MTKRDLKRLTVIAVIAGLFIYGILLLSRAYAPQNLKDFNADLANAESNTSKAHEPSRILTQPSPIAKTSTIEKSFIHVTKDDLLSDIMANYPTTPNRAKLEIIDAIMEVDKKYNINPLIPYSVGHVESSWNPYILHKEVLIDIDGKKLSIRAMGAMGMVYEWWGEKLIKAEIIKSREDLLDPIASVQAFGFVYNELRKMPMHKSASNKDESALLRYFGGDYKSYLDKIDDKIGTLIASKLYKSK